MSGLYNHTAERGCPRQAEGAEAVRYDIEQLGVVAAYLRRIGRHEMAARVSLAMVQLCAAATAPDR